MRTLALAVAAVLLGGTVPCHAQDQDDVADRIRKRVEKEIEESGKRLSRELRKLVRSELEKAGVAKVKQKKAPSGKDFASRVRDLARRIKDDGGINSRLKKVLLSDAGIAFARQVMRQEGFEDPAEVAEFYFDEDEQGRLTLMEEYELFAEDLLDMVEQGKGEEKKEEQKKEEPAGKPWIGIVPAVLTDRERRALGLEPPNGIKIFEVREGSPAGKAGLKTGDIVTAFDGTPLSERNIGELLAARKPGDTVKLTVLREKNKREIRLVLGVKEEEQ
ncbi:MAG: S1C family serine protease [Planctomycetota bacterium]|jgi:hypothetical protein